MENKENIHLKDILNKINNGEDLSQNNIKNLNKLVQKNDQLDIIDHALDLKEKENYKDSVVKQFVKFLKDLKFNKIDCYFFPDKKNVYKIVDLINSSKKSLKICLLLITNDILANALIKAKERNVNVKLIVEDSQIGILGCDVERLIKEGIEIKTEYKKDALMHHKYCIIDNKVLITGSFNWTVKAVKFNFENIIVLKDINVIKTFNENFNSLWNEFFHINEKNKAEEHWNKIMEQEKNNKKKYKKKY